jgi:hypothetical protein
MTFKVWHWQDTAQWTCTITFPLKRPVDRNSKMITIQNGMHSDSCCFNDHSQFFSELFLFDSELQYLDPNDDFVAVSCASNDICLILT